MAAELKKGFVERRRGPDAVVKAVWWIIGTSWGLIIMAILLTSEAQPRFETFYDRMVKEPVRGYVDRNLMEYVFYLLLANLAVCIVGFVLNMMRHKRKTDKFSKSILTLGTMTFIGIVWYLLRYGL